MGNWFISGNKSQLRFYVSESGSLSFCGECNHDSELSWQLIDDRLDTPKEVKSRIQQATCFWKIIKEKEENSLNLPCMYKEYLANDGKKLKDMLAKPIEQPWGYIIFWTGDREFENDHIGIIIMVPENFFLQYQRLFENVISSNDLTYDLCVEFDGFRSHQLEKWNPNEYPDATEGITRVDDKEEWINFRGSPSAEEFLNGRLCFINSVSLGIKVKNQDEG